MRLFFLLFIGLVISCSPDNSTSDSTESKAISFGIPQLVTIQGYNDDIMEPFLSDDGNTLFFNNSNNPAINTNLHFAARIDDLNFEYKGELKGINTEYLEGVATMDNSDNFYFVSTRSYEQTLSSIYSGNYTNDSISDIQIVNGLSKNIPGWLNFDVEVSKDGNFLFFVDGRFDQNGGPYEADLVLAEKVNGEWIRSEDQSLFKYINSDELEYAACISSDLLELYFTRLEAPITNSSVAQIYVSTRNSADDVFNKPYKINQITGFVEGATISPNDKKIYYHKLEDDKFVLYMIQKD
jgi:hypothetical protein